MENNMRVYNRKDNMSHITVASYKNKILVKNGFVPIVKGNHHKFQTIRPDILMEKYILPPNAVIQD
jgi:hypothetical protein